MLRYAVILACAILWLPVDVLWAIAPPQVTIIYPVGASFAERLAAREVRRYVYLRTRPGPLLRIGTPVSQGAERIFVSGPLIVIGRKDRPEITALLREPQLQTRIAVLRPQEYLLARIEHAGGAALLLVGGDDIGVLYAAYHFAEHLGVRFYMHGDVVPDQRIRLELRAVDETHKPLFPLRGIQPFHDFPEGPDWWSRDGYKAIMSQLPKMGMNFIGLHTYPEGGVGPEPLVWIGPPQEVAADGKVKASYPSRHYTTNANPPAWGYRPGKTSDFVFGTAELFDRDDYGADYMRGVDPWSKMSPEQCNALFDRVGHFFGDVFGFGRRLGIKSCIGTETPLTIPTQVKQRLQAAGKSPADPRVVQEVYEGMFQRIAKIYPLDYYWLWTPEGWTWETVKQAQIDATLADVRAAMAAARKVKAPFTMATCGWVLGPPQNPALFDNVFPKNMPMSCINRTVGNTPVEPGFSNVSARPKWAIPWLEDDPGLTMPQLWAGRMRRDAADALKYGCTGLMGIHWRTRVLGPNVSALADAAWKQTGWSGPATKAADGKSQFSPVADFYADWCESEFGPEATAQIAAVFTRLDGHLPRPADWVTGPGSIRPDARPWEQVRKEYAFVDELAALQPQVKGAGNLERFDYWLNTFCYLRSIGQVRYVWGRFDVAMKKVRAEKDPAAQKKLARELALPIRKELVAAFAELHRYLLATVSNPGELGTVANWQQQTLPTLLTAPGQELAKLLGADLPADAIPSKEHVGKPRLFVPEVRTNLLAGEPLNLRIIILGGPPQRAALHWRPLGSAEYSEVPLTHVARGVYTVTLPADSTKADFEYYVEAEVAGQPLRFPATAPAMNQTIVTVE
jgi:hypothetical protein